MNFLMTAACIHLFSHRFHWLRPKEEGGPAEHCGLFDRTVTREDMTVVASWKKIFSRRRVSHVSQCERQAIKKQLQLLSEICFVWDIILFVWIARHVLSVRRTCPCANWRCQLLAAGERLRSVVSPSSTECEDNVSLWGGQLVLHRAAGYRPSKGDHQLYRRGKICTCISY